jgi:23S rRNA (guanosine2251-2'-O)-methyltransferase
MTELLYGKQVARQILADDSRRVLRIYLACNDSELEKLAVTHGVPLERVDRRRLSALTHSEHHQGVAVEIEPYRLHSVEELTAHRHHRYGFLILLDELEDPQNLGAILRTADAVQADGVIFRKTRSVGLTPAAAKVSAGAVDTVPCAAVTNLTRTLQELKKKGYWVVGADMEGQDYRTISYDFDTVLVIGSEGRGISRLVRQECDYMAALPMKGKISSLNAAVSAGILMYSVYAARFPL